MNWLKSIAIAFVLVAAMTASAEAGRVGGPMTVTVTVPAGQSVYYDVPFNANELATANVRGTGRSMVQVNLYDADGNVAIGHGNWDRVSASMNVYRGGSFRIEIVNIGPQDNTVVLMTN